MRQRLSFFCLSGIVSFFEPWVSVYPERSRRAPSGQGIFFRLLATCCHSDDGRNLDMWSGCIVRYYRPDDRMGYTYGYQTPCLIHSLPNMAISIFASYFSPLISMTKSLLSLISTSMFFIFLPLLAVVPAFRRPRQGLVFG
jgi:hypothetical protein